ncbi:MAG TPA: hypothetical protein VEL70_00270 [Candidatus Acidoferrum sp.]|nr:hypothetical protein [Candidatus Acidoferrum sp.]
MTSETNEPEKLNNLGLTDAQLHFLHDIMALQLRNYKTKVLPTLIALYSSNIDIDIVKQTNERLEMYREILGKIEQLDKEDNTMTIEQYQKIGCLACDSSEGRRDSHIHFLTIAINNQLDNAFEYLCRKHGHNIDLKIAQLIESELDAAATEEELKKHFKR